MKTNSGLILSAFVTSLSAGFLIGLSFGLGPSDHEKEYREVTNKLFHYIETKYPAQWDTITFSRPYIEYDLFLIKESEK